MKSKINNPPIIAIPSIDPGLTTALNDFKNDIKSEGVLAVKTNEGKISDTLYAEAPLVESAEHLVYGAYALVIQLPLITWGATAVASGIVGHIGVEQYKKLIPHIKKLLGRVPPSNKALIIKSIERSRNFSLQVGFSVDTSISSTECAIALNQIPEELKKIVALLPTLSSVEVIIVSYNEKSHTWDFNNSKFLRANHGTTSLRASRVGKLYGHAPKDVVDSFIKPATNEWDYINFDRHPEIDRQALKFRTSYYQRLYIAEHILGALIHNFGAVISVDIFPSFLDAPKGKIPMPLETERRIGGHSVALTGYDGKGNFEFINSWGQDWGDNGKGYLPKDYIDKYLIEAWTSKLLIEGDNTEKIIERGLLSTSYELPFNFEHKTGPLLIPGREHLHVVNLFNPNTPEKYSAWAHFLIDSETKAISIEELYQDPDFPSMSLTIPLINKVESIARNLGMVKITGWISIIDCPNEVVEKDYISILNELGYAVTPETSKFRGCLYVYSKDLNG